MNMNRTISASILAACIVIAPILAFSATELPDATLELSGGAVAAGVGYTWGKGTLNFQGKSYPVTVKGLSVNSFGAENIRASADVYHLRKLSDFDGNYAGASAGVAVAGGGVASALENQNGVVVMLHAHALGIGFNISIDGVAINLAK